MYFAQSIDEHRLEIFRILLQRTIEGYGGYKEEISKVISEAKELCQGRKDLYSIDKKLYPLITFLDDNGEDFLGQIENVDSLSDDQYKELLNIFRSTGTYVL